MLRSVQTTNYQPTNIPMDLVTLQMKCFKRTQKYEDIFCNLIILEKLQVNIFSSINYSKWKEVGMSSKSQALSLFNEWKLQCFKTDNDINADNDAKNDLDLDCMSPPHIGRAA